VYTTFWHEVWKVLLWSLVLGAGLPVVYALGIRGLAIGTTSDDSAVQGQTSQTEGVGRNPLGVALAAVCFLVVVAGVAVALAYIIAAGHGEQLSFSHGYPTFVPKS
jgi:hypothetical protein